MTSELKINQLSDLKINQIHPCKECLVRSICRLDCKNLEIFMTDTYVKISEFMELNFSKKPVFWRINVRYALLHEHINQWRAFPIIKRNGKKE